jgi:hypothetical protein
MSRCTRHVAVLSLLLLGVPAATLGAQGLSIGGHVGQYTPTQEVYEVTRAGVAGPVGKYELGSTSTRGGGLTLWLGDRIGVSASGGTASTRMTFTGGAATDPEVELDGAEIRFGSLQGIAITSRSSAALQPYVSAGLAYVRRGGPAFATRTDKGHFGFAIGAGLRVRVIKALLTGGVEFTDYAAKHQVNGGPDRSFLQRDIQLKGGVEVPLFGR